jgi:hypothetical protein
MNKFVLISCGWLAAFVIVGAAGCALDKKECSTYKDCESGFVCINDPASDYSYCLWGSGFGGDDGFCFPTAAEIVDGDRTCNDNRVFQCFTDARCGGKTWVLIDDCYAGNRTCGGTPSQCLPK